MRKRLAIIILLTYACMCVAQHNFLDTDSKKQFGGNISPYSTHLTFIKIMDDDFMIKTISTLSSGFCDTSSNELAKRVFLARIELIRAENASTHSRLTDDIKCIVTNFDIITHNHYKIKKDYCFIGEIEIWYDSESLLYYEKWFEENKELLCYDSKTGYLYVKQ